MIQLSFPLSAHVIQNRLEFEARKVISTSDRHDHPLEEYHRYLTEQIFTVTD